MGTETFSLVQFLLLLPLFIVKLNNPLMGTETFLGHILQLVKFEIVKLNNPLMGAETFVFQCVQW